MNNRITNIVIVLVVVAIGFATGTYYERYGRSLAHNGSGSLVNQSDGKPSDVDFSLFWEAWNVVHDRYVDKEELNNQDLVYGAIDGLLGSLDDPYTVFFEPEDSEKFRADIRGEFFGVGIEIGIKEGRLIVLSPLEDTPGHKAGLLAGDFIIGIDGAPTDGIAIHEAVDKIRGKRKTVVVLSIFREGFKESRDFEIVREKITIPGVKLSFLDSTSHNLRPDQNIAHLKLLTFNENSEEQFEDATQMIIDNGTDGIIFDLRNNPGGLLDVSIRLASYFLESDIPVVIERLGNGSSNTFSSTSNGKLKDFPFVILVNRGSASASEIVAGALRDNLDIKIVGTTTFGKGSVQEINELSNDTSMKITVAKWLTPRGTSINEEGIVPDDEIDMKIEDYENNLDPQLDKALEILKKQI